MLRYTLVYGASVARAAVAVTSASLLYSSASPAAASEGESRKTGFCPKATLKLAMSVAAANALPGVGLAGGLPVSEEELGFLYTRRDGKPLGTGEVAALKAALDAVVASDAPIEKQCADSWQAAQLKLDGQCEALALLASRVPLGPVQTVRVGDVTRLAPYDAPRLATSTGVLKGGYTLSPHAPSGGALLAPTGSPYVADGVPSDKESTTRAVLEVAAWGKVRVRAPQRGTHRCKTCTDVLLHPDMGSG